MPRPDPVTSGILSHVRTTVVLGRAVLLAGVLIAAGCSSSRAYFRPAETTVVETVDRVVGAEYQLGAGAKRSGELRVWCLEAHIERDHPTAVDVSIEVENSSSSELRLLGSEITLQDVEVRGARLGPVNDPEARLVVIPPNRVIRSDFRFLLPKDVRPRDIHSFRIAWVVEGDDKAQFRQQTTFVRGRASYGTYGSYGGWGYPAWGWGWGLGWGWSYPAYPRYRWGPHRWRY